MRFTRCGWPSSVLPDLKSFYSRQELTVEEDCLLRGVHAVVPEKLRSRILRDLHQDHGSVVRMKVIACSYIWWLCMDADIKYVASPLHQANR